MYKLSDQTKADLAVAWARTNPILQKIAVFALRATGVLTLLFISVGLLFYSFIVGVTWIGICAAAGVFYLNYRDAVAERRFEEEWKARQEARRKNQGW